MSAGLRKGERVWRPSKTLEGRSCIARLSCMLPGRHLNAPSTSFISAPHLVQYTGRIVPRSGGEGEEDHSTPGRASCR